MPYDNDRQGHGQLWAVKNALKSVSMGVRGPADLWELLAGDSKNESGKYASPDEGVRKTTRKIGSAHRASVVLED